MDCCICTTMPVILRPPRNTICGACYEAAKTAISFVTKHETDQSDVDHVVSSPSSQNFCKGQPLAILPKWMNNIKGKEDEWSERIDFLSGFVNLFREQILTDIQLKPGNDGPSIPAHKALLAARSQVFKNMLDSDSCKLGATNETTITLPELKHEELESLLEFLYSGSLPKEKLEKHIYSLTLAADKYDIPFLLRFCERHMLTTLDSVNALDVLEVSYVCSLEKLKDTALNFLVKNMEDVVFTSKYEEFVLSNPHLGVQITRALFLDLKNKNVDKNN